MLAEIQSQIALINEKIKSPESFILFPKKFKYDADKIIELKRRKHQLSLIPDVDIEEIGKRVIYFIYGR